MNPKSQSPHDVLGVMPDASDAEIRAAYLRKVREHPPDGQGDAFERVRDAYEVLRDPRRRAEHMPHGRSLPVLHLAPGPAPGPPLPRGPGVVACRPADLGGPSHDALPIPAPL